MDREMDNMGTVNPEYATKQDLQKLKIKLKKYVAQTNKELNHLKQKIAKADFTVKEQAAQIAASRDDLTDLRIRVQHIEETVGLNWQAVEKIAGFLNRLNERFDKSSKYESEQIDRILFMVEQIVKYLEMSNKGETVELKTILGEKHPQRYKVSPN